MTKAILIMDMPKNCWECDINQCDTDSRWCGKEFKDIRKNFENKTKPDWCPLRALPEKKEYKEAKYYKNRKDGLGEMLTDALEVDIWNECIDEILAE